MIVVVEAEHVVVFGSFSIAGQCSSSLAELKIKLFTNRRPGHADFKGKKKNLSFTKNNGQFSNG